MAVDRFRLDDRFFSHDEKTLHEVLKLADVSRPRIVHQSLHRGLGQLLRGTAVLVGELPEEMPREKRYVRPALPERRHIYRDDVQPEVEVFAEPVGLYFRFEVLVRGRDDPDVHPHRDISADAVELVFLKNAEHFRLSVEVHVADLVKKDGSLVGRLELSAPHSRRAGEGPFLVAEQFALYKLVRNGRAVHLDEGAVPSGAGVVEGPRHQFLAHPVLASYHHPALRVADRHNSADKLFHGGALADDVVLLPDLVPEGDILFFQPTELYGSLDGQQQFFPRNGLFDKVVSAELGGLDRGADGSVPAHHYDGGVGPFLLEDAQKLKPVHAGHHNVEHSEGTLGGGLLIERLCS